MRSRREFLGSLAGAGSFAAAAARLNGLHGATASFDHVVVVCMENRSFDHFLGWLPNIYGAGVSGNQNLVYPTPSGGSQATWYLGSNTSGCAYKDPDHSWSGSRIEYDGGKCDGWLLDTSNDIYSVGYYTQVNLPFLGQAAVNWTVCDNYFAAIMGPTQPNRLYLHSAATDRTSDTSANCKLPTIWDRLAAKGISRRYYYTDTSFLWLYGLFKYLSISAKMSQFYSDCQNGTLPAVSYVDPGFNGESTGTSNDDHPHGDIRNGEYFLNQVYSAVTSSKNWPSTVLIITFDEWGGFFDHVSPPLVADSVPGAAPDAVINGQNLYLRGFRVPCIVISPFAQRGAVVHDLFDHTSILKMIETRWSLTPLTTRDANANDLGSVLTATANPAAPNYSVPGPFSAHC
jgi:phospholipase C